MIAFSTVRRTFAALAAVSVLSFSNVTLAENVLVEGMPSGEYQLDLSHASVVWKLNHVGFSTYIARFADFDVNLNLDTEEFTKSTVNVDIKIASVQTAFPDGSSFNEKIANKILNAQEHPSIVFKSNAVSALNGNAFTITGDMTMNGQTHPVILNATLNKSVLSHPFKKIPAIGFSAVAMIDRTVWGVDDYAPAVGTDVKIEIEAEFTQEVEVEAGQDVSG